MTSSSGFKECSCWCIFTIATVTLLFSIGLTLSDLTLIAENEDSIDHIVNTPISQLRCLQVCETWYTFQNDQTCCDRYNSNLCVQKKSCKEGYILSQKIQIEILKNDAYSELVMIIICSIVMSMVSFRKFRIYKVPKENLVETDQENLELKIIEAANKLLQLKECKRQQEITEKNNPEPSYSFKKKESIQTQTSIRKQKPMNQQYCQCVIDFIQNHHCDICDDIQSSRILNQQEMDS